MGGKSSGIYKSLNCGLGSLDNKKNVSENLNIVSRRIGCKQNSLILLNQIHSNKVFFINKKRKKKIVGDGVVTAKKGLGLAILSADCAPVMFYDPKNELIGAAHIGWKGAYKRIVKKMTKYFVKNGSYIKNLKVVIGPSISKSNYEVKMDFKKKFLKRSRKNKIYFLNKKDKIFFSLKDFIKGELINLGIKNIEIINKDTYNPHNNFFSARRSLKKNYMDYGRNISVIMIK
tara:strand:+ start:5081 stop:5773 length:693 start_codon:yes stop_codon:yes gene_type:complete